MTVDGLNVQDLHNYSESKKLLGPSSALADDLLKAYAIHDKALTPALRTRAQKIAAVLMHGLCQTHLVVGATCLFRLHTASAFRETRAALEVAGIAYAIQHNPGSLEIFLADEGEDANARRAAQKTFKPENIFPYSHPLLKVLGNSYKLASQLSHTNSLTLRRHFGEQKPDRVMFHHQDVDPKEAPVHLPKLFFWLCMSHLSILSLLDTVFDDAHYDLTAFRREREYVLDKFCRFNSGHTAMVEQFQRANKA